VHTARLVVRFSAAFLAATALSGCTVGPDYEKPGAWWSPASWFTDTSSAQDSARASVPVAEPPDPAWWKLFGDPLLVSLEDRMASANLDVRMASVRLAEARASLGIARADAYPSVNGNTSYSREQQSKKGVLSLTSGGGGSPATSANGLGGRQGGVPNTSLFAPFNLFQYGFDASWELDLWGRVRRNEEAATAQSAASEEDRRNTLLTAQAELARDYVQLRGTQRSLQITRENLRTAQQSLQLTRDRASGGLVTDLDVANAAAEVETTAAQIPTLEAQQAQLVNAVAFLLGEQPHATAAALLKPGAVPPVPPRVPVGVPSELARRRPDIRQAEAQLHAATADVGVAVADFYPRVTLSASLGIQALQPKNLFTWDARQYGFGPTVTLPIFQGGQLRSTLRLRKEQQQEAAVNYERTVLNAWHEVDNALTAYDAEQQRRDELLQAVAQNRRALGLAQSRYRQGLIDFLTVLDTQRSLLQTEQQLADSTTTVSSNLVALYKALGGGWEDAFPVAGGGPKSVHGPS
jgi:NodT family efflux transporter outer membrane factor (OMF) lipoprotein